MQSLISIRNEFETMEGNHALSVAAALDMGDGRRCFCVVMVTFQRHMEYHWVVRDNQYQLLLCHSVDIVFHAPSSNLIGRQVRSDIDDRSASPKTIFN